MVFGICVDYIVDLCLFPYILFSGFCRLCGLENQSAVDPLGTAHPLGCRQVQWVGFHQEVNSQTLVIERYFSY